MSTEVFDLMVLLRAKQEGMAALKSTENGFMGIAKAGIAAGAVLAGAVVAGAIEAYNRTEALGQAAYEMGEKFGLSGEQASGFISVAQRLGLTSEQVSNGFKFLSKNAEAMRLSLQATGKVPAILAQAYKELGIKVLDAGGHVKSANQLMLETADVFKKMKDGPEKAALAQKLFGKSGQDLIPILNLGKQGILDMEAAGVKLGTVMSTDQVNSIHKAFLAHKEFDAALQGVTNRIGIAVLPIMSKFFNFIVSTAIPAVGRLVTYFQQHLWPAIQQVWGAFMNLLSPAIQYIKDHFDDLKPVLVAVAIVFGIALGAVVIAILAVIAAVVLVVAGIAWLVNQMKTRGPEFLGHIQDMVIGAIRHFQGFVKFVQDLPTTIWKGAVAIGTTIWKGIVAGLQAAGGAIMAAIKSLLPGGANGPVVLALHAAGVPGFQYGGIVPGPIGRPMLAIVHGGETVTPAGRGGGTTILPIVFSPIPPNREQIAVIREAIRRVDREQR